MWFLQKDGTPPGLPLGLKRRKLLARGRFLAFCGFCAFCRLCGFWAFCAAIIAFGRWRALLLFGCGSCAPSTRLPGANWISNSIISSHCSSVRSRSGIDNKERKRFRGSKVVTLGAAVFTVCGATLFTGCVSTTTSATISGGKLKGFSIGIDS